MPELIILRLYPTTPMAPTDFTTILQSLTITAFDVSVEDPTGGFKLGTASGLAASLQDTVNLTEATILQHYIDVAEPLQPPTLKLESVATAIIIASPPQPHPEYPSAQSYDLRLEITRNGGFQFATELEFNVEVTPADPLPPLQTDYFSMAASAFYALAPSANGTISLPSNGQPPPFASLRTAIDGVLAKDPSGTNLAQIAPPLTAAQAEQIASEIAWDRTANPQPAPPPDSSSLAVSLGAMYTRPPVDPGIKADDAEQARMQFEGQLTAYRAGLDAQAVRLAAFVSAAAAAVTCEALSATASPAAVSIPLLTKAETSTTIPEAVVPFLVSGYPEMSFAVPAAYFYALAASLPGQVTAQQRFEMACSQHEQDLLKAFQTALDVGIMAPGDASLTLDQAARRLVALGTAKGAGPPITPSATDMTLITGWLASSGPTATIDTDYWSPAAATQPAAYLGLLLEIVTDNSPTLITAIKAPPLNVASVADLVGKTDQQWRDFFLNAPALLPDFTVPGTPAERAEAYIRHLRQFFAVPLAMPEPVTPIVAGPPTIGLSIGDVFAAFGASYLAAAGKTFTFGAAWDATARDSAIQKTFPGDARAQAWLAEALDTLNALFSLADVGLPELHFSLMEALFARGFTSSAQVAALSLQEFQDALDGTVAFPAAAAIHAKAGPGPAPSPPPGGFKPVNPDGGLTDCVPPCHLSPLGPVQYLHELLAVTAAATCDDLKPSGDGTSLRTLLAGRRGDVGLLHVTAANVEVRIPVIDLVNESLEALAAAVPNTAGGAVLDTRPEHDAHVRLAAVPQHSSPATPVAAPAAYDKLRRDFTSPALPYAQALDICRSNLKLLGTGRFEAMRRFRKQITEFAIDPAHEPDDFQTHLWRYPVRFNIALEYLHISIEEYDLLYGHGLSKLLLHELYGFTLRSVDKVSWLDTVLHVPEFLRRTGLDYCAFLELWRCGFVAFQRDGATADFPDCLPCCPDNLVIAFPPGADRDDALTKLAVFIRLWRRLREQRTEAISFTLLADTCKALVLFDASDGINPDFLRQLAALLILCDDLRLPLTARLLALWTGQAGDADWDWAVARLIGRIEEHAEARHGARRCEPELIKLIAANLDPLSRLCGFDPATPTDTWHARPAATLRFVEVLAKIYASDFHVSDILFLFTNFDHLDGDDPFPMPSPNEALDLPLELPDDAREHGLWALQRKLLRIGHDDSDEAAERWTWPRIETALRESFGLSVPTGTPDPISDFGRHFFPGVLERHGQLVTPQQRQWRAALSLAHTAPLMWNTRPESPFRYDAGTQELSVQLPLRDEATLETLAHVHKLSPAEQAAVQELYFGPRATLAPFAAVFENFPHAADALIAEASEAERFALFRCAFARFHRRCRVIAAHLAEHVADAARRRGREHHEHGGHDREDAEDVAWLVLRGLHADENFAKTPWEDDTGTPPALTWGPMPSGGAFAALLGLLGTGLLGTFTAHGDAAPVWREVRGPLTAFGHEHDEWNAPVPTVLPSLALTLTDAQRRFVTVRNGFATRDADDAPLGGAERFAVRWDGVLLVEHGGRYCFHAGAPTPEGCAPDFEKAETDRWRLTLRRGQRSWVVLNHRWPGEGSRPVRRPELDLDRGAYAIVAEFEQSQPTFGEPEAIHRRHAGFEVKYAGPDSGEELIAIPLHRLFCEAKAGMLGQGLGNPDRGSTARAAFLDRLYTSSLRDIRRTYQRAFKAVLLAHCFGLSARRRGQRHSELVYMLDHAEAFLGTATVRTGPASFKSHQAWFDPDLLPVADSYHPPDAAQDSRAAPSPQRQAALFDWWERLFDYTAMRRQTRNARERPAWLLFLDADEHQSDDPAQLLQHLGIDLRHAPLVTSYFDLLADYTLARVDLTDERWPVRAWHAERWLRRLLAHFHPRAIETAAPQLWAADNPGLAVGAPPMSGNMNLTAFMQDGSFRSGEPRRYVEIRRLNDGLRARARDALTAFLCGMDRVPLPWSAGLLFARTADELGELLLQDVCAGLRQEASRIEDAIGAVQAFVQRARLGLEPSFPVAPEFVPFWEGRFASFQIWQACKRRELYRENWIDWEELRRAQEVEAFRLLDEELRRATLTVAAPGGMEWWPSQPVPTHPSLALLQAREPAGIRLLAPDPPLAEGFSLLGTPERDARPSWLAPFVEQARRPPSHPKVVPKRRSAPKSEMRALANGILESADQLPFWIRTAVRLGARFIRIAAAGAPPASACFAPRPKPGREECCAECGCTHPLLMDEYYFWLMDARVFDPVVQNADEGVTPPDPPTDWARADPTTDWDRPDGLAALLHWPTRPAVHLFWCRVHNGEFQNPRRSNDALEIAPLKLPAGPPPQLNFLGRTMDSLRFEVSNGVAPPGFMPPPLPGFRYDMATNSAVVLPLVAALPSPTTFVGGLAAYPFLAWFQPGAPVASPSPFSVALAVAARLRAHCRFDAALKWYEIAFNPLQRDDTWAQCPPVVDPKPLRKLPVERSSADRTAGAPGIEPAALSRRVDAPCCPTQARNDEVARDRAILLHALETMLQWIDALLCRGAPEAARQASTICETMRRILGPTPPRVVTHDDGTAAPMLIADFTARGVPLNPRLMALYERTADRSCLIHSSLNGRRLRGAAQAGDMECCGGSHWGGASAHDGWHSTAALCADEDDWCTACCTPYRFTFQVQKALELAEAVRSLGAGLLAAYEKGDTEYLAAVRATQERQLLELGLEVRRNAWRDADWQVQALQKTKEGAQTRLRYYQKLISDGLITGENLYVLMTGYSTGFRTQGNVSEAVAQGESIAPDEWFGGAGTMGSPLWFQQLPTGSKLAAQPSIGARILNALAEIAATGAGLALTEAGWERREAEWREQVDVTTIEVEQIARQILGAERRRDMALRELNNSQRQIEHAAEVQDFVRDKLTNHQLYLFLQQETAALHRLTWELAMHAARTAERAFNLERGYTAQRFLPEERCDTLHEQLLAGDRLQLALRRMEKAYLDANCREYELTKHVSLRLACPLAFLELQLTGRCEVEIPEWMFDLDYPGHYMRRIRGVTLTIPCVVGPYAGVHCRLTLLNSVTRIDPRLAGPRAPCCEHEDREDGHQHREHWRQREHREHRPERRHPDGHCARCDGAYDWSCDDQRFVRAYAATEAIATSSGQNDAGLFELNFRDERYLPFEFAGAISRWRIELPPENNEFDLDSLADVVLHVSYTAREGGDLLRQAAIESAQRHLPGDGLRLFDVQHDLPDAWHQLTGGVTGSAGVLPLRLGRDRFPFVSGQRGLEISHIELFFELADPDAHAGHVVRFFSRAAEREPGDPDEYRHDVVCVADAAWHGLYRGVLPLSGARLERRSGERGFGSLHFPRDCGRITRVFLICLYRVQQGAARHW